MQLTSGASKRKKELAIINIIAGIICAFIGVITVDFGGMDVIWIAVILLATGIMKCISSSIEKDSAILMIIWGVFAMAIAMINGQSSEYTFVLVLFAIVVFAYGILILTVKNKEDRCLVGMILGCILLAGSWIMANVDDSSLGSCIVIFLSFAVLFTNSYTGRMDAKEERLGGK